MWLRRVSIPGSSAGSMETPNVMSRGVWRNTVFYFFEVDVTISPDSHKRQQQHKKESACPIFDPTTGLAAVSCDGGCVMTAVFADKCVTSCSTN